MDVPCIKVIHNEFTEFSVCGISDNDCPGPGIDVNVLAIDSARQKITAILN